MDYSKTPTGSTMSSVSGIEIDLMKILTALKRNFLIIILAALLGGCFALSYSWFIVKPTYTASVLAYINKNTVSISGAELVLGSNENAVSTYTTILQSRTTLEEIAKTAGLAYSPEKLQKMIKTTYNAEKSSFITIEVSSETPAEAELIANTIASVLPIRVSDIVEGSTLRVVDYAVIPSSRSTSSLSRNFAIGLLSCGILVCAVIAVSVIVITNHAPPITSSTDLMQYYSEYPVLGVIRDMSVSENKYKYSDYGYGKYSGYYTKTNPEENTL